MTTLQPEPNGYLAPKPKVAIVNIKLRHEL